MHQCTLREIELDCDPTSIIGFLNQFDHAKHVRYIQVTKTECLTALQTNLTKYGKLVFKKGILTTTQHMEYSCRWMRHTAKRFQAFTISRVKASLKGDSPEIKQSLTKTTCYYKNFACRPNEFPDSLIIWERNNHNFSIYRDLGRFNITRTNDYVTIRDKGIGGTIVEQAAGQILLDTGIVIVKHTLKEHTPFAKLAKKFVQNVQLSAAAELAETKFIENLWIEDA